MSLLALLLLMLGPIDSSGMDVSSKEEKFIDNIISLEKEQPWKIYKPDKNHVYVAFAESFYVLNSDGFVDDLFVIEDGKWISMGKESE